MFKRINFRNMAIFTFGTTFSLHKTMYLEQENKSPNFRDIHHDKFNLKKRNIEPSSPKLPRYEQTHSSKNTIKEKIKEFRSASLYEDLADVFNYKTEDDTECEYLNIGPESFIKPRQFIQVDLNNDKPVLKTNKEAEFNLFDEEETELVPENYFNKLLVFRIDNTFYGLSSFCGYDLTDLKDGVFLGNKVVCPTCLSEYNIENGIAEAGPNVKFLATFPVSLRKNEILVQVPKGKIPLFAKAPYQEFAEVDPRHLVLIGDTETTFGAIDTMIKVFSGRISIITHQTGSDFVDFGKLSKSFFPLKAKYSRLLDNDFLSKHKILLFDDRVSTIDAGRKIISLKSGQKMPFDKVLIATGSGRAVLREEYKNLHYLFNIVDHAKIHNEIIKNSTTSVVIIGNNFRAIEIASSIRRYLDAIGKDKTRISIVSNDKWFAEKYGNEQTANLLQDYLSRNRIFVFKDTKIKVEPDETNKNIKSLLLLGDKKTFRIPGQVFIYESGIAFDCKSDFIEKINIPVQEEEVYRIVSKNVVIPDERFSLHPSTRYPLVFSAGSCTWVNSPMLTGPIRTGNNTLY